MSDEDKLRILPFSGKRKDWRKWSSKFKAYAQTKGYLGILTGEELAPGESVVVADNDTENKRLRKANISAYNALLHAMMSDTAYDRVENARDSDFPNGNAKVAWDKLVKKYQPDSLTEAASLEKKFEKLTLSNPKKDPEDFVEALLTLRNQLKKVSDGKIEIDDDKVMRHVMNNLPEAYDITVTELGKRYGASTNPLTIDDMLGELSDRYTILMRRFNQGTTESSEEEEDQEPDIALMTGEVKEVVLEEKVVSKPSHGGGNGNPYPSQFKGMCNHCGKYGHKAVNCPDRQLKDNGSSIPTDVTVPQANPMNPMMFQGGGYQPYPRMMGMGGGPPRRFNGVCNFCGIYGHRMADCRKRMQAMNQMMGQQGYPMGQQGQSMRQPGQMMGQGFRPMMGTPYMMGPGQGMRADQANFVSMMQNNNGQEVSHGAMSHQQFGQPNGFGWNPMTGGNEMGMMGAGMQNNRETTTDDMTEQDQEVILIGVEVTNSETIDETDPYPIDLEVTKDTEDDDTSLSTDNDEEPWERILEEYRNEDEESSIGSVALVEHKTIIKTEDDRELRVEHNGHPDFDELTKDTWIADTGASATLQTMMPECLTSLKVIQTSRLETGGAFKSRRWGK